MCNHVGFPLSDCGSFGHLLQDKPQQKAEKLDAGPELVRAPPAKLEARRLDIVGFSNVKSVMSSSIRQVSETSWAAQVAKRKAAVFLLPL